MAAIWYRGSRDHALFQKQVASFRLRIGACEEASPATTEAAEELCIKISRRLLDPAPPLKLVAADALQRATHGSHNLGI